MPDGEFQKRLQVAISADMERRIQQHCARNQIKKTAFIRQAIELALKKPSAWPPSVLSSDRPL